MSLSPVSYIDRSINAVAFPWKYRSDTCNKIALWAAFFFIGWVYHPLKAVYSCYKILIADCFGKDRIDSIPEKLRAFHNPRVKGQIHGIYITTNETNLEATRQLLQSHPRAGKDQATIHIGCATWYNLDIICQRKSTYGLIVDFNPKNVFFIKKTAELIKGSPSRNIFKEKMVKYLESLTGEERELFFHKDQRGSPLDRIRDELSREGSWLKSDRSYLYMKKLVSNNRLVAITEDITNYKKFSAIRQFLDESSVVIDSVYLSNVCNFMKSARDQDLFTRTITHLVSDSTIFISCPLCRDPNTGEEKILVQKPVLGSNLTNLFILNEILN